MKHLLALSLTAVISFTALAAHPVATACPVKGEFAIKEQGVRAPLASATPIVSPQEYKIVTAPATSADPLVIADAAVDHAINTKGTGASGRVGPPVIVAPPPSGGDCNDKSPR